MSGCHSEDIVTGGIKYMELNGSIRWSISVILTELLSEIFDFSSNVDRFHAEE